MKIVRLLLFFVLAALSGCSDEPADPVYPEVDRTVLVYIASDNSLDAGGYAQTNIEGMAAGMKGQKNVNLIVYVDLKSDAPRLLQIGNDGAVREVETYAEENSASTEVLRRVIDRTKLRFPARDYGLVLWSHGSGWLPESASKASTRAFGQDGTSWIEIGDLAGGLHDNEFAFIVFDACYMSSVETYYELRNKASYLIGAPNEILGNGFPYERVVPYFFQRGEEGAVKIGEEYADHYSEKNGLEGAIAVVKTSGLEPLAAALKPVVEAHIEAVDRISIAPVQQFGRNQYRNKIFDLADFVRQFATGEEYLAFEERLSAAVIYEAHTPHFITYFIRTSCGLSTYIPQSGQEALNEAYQRTQWYRAVYPSR